jgi:hypothetical protein
VIVPFGILFAFHPGSDKELNSEALRCLMGCLISLDRAYLRAMARKGRTVPHLYDSGIVYGRTQSWDTIPDMLAKGYGDCKSLTAMLCAQALESGHHCEPVFRFAIRPNDGGLDFHILCLTDGTMSYRGRTLELYHDPSKVLGMLRVYASEQ